MTNKLYNLAREVTATTGTGTITLAGAASGWLTFVQAGAASGDVVSYAINDPTGPQSESGYGTYTVSGGTRTLTRNVINSTNSNAAISLSGSAQVFISPLATDIVNPAESYTWSGQQTFTDGLFANAIAGAGVIAPGVNSIIGNGSTADDGSIQTVLGAYKHVYIFPGTYKIGANRTWPVGITIHVLNGALIEPASGVTLTINSEFCAGLYQVFDVAASGSAVVGVAPARPEWWGAKADGTADASGAINAAYASLVAAAASTTHTTPGGHTVYRSASTMERHKLLLSEGVYYIANPLSFALNQHMAFRMEGAGTCNGGGAFGTVNMGGTCIMGAKSFAGSTVLTITGGGSNLDWGLSGFSIINEDSTSGACASTAVSLGDTSALISLQSCEWSPVENVTVHGFATGFLVTNTRVVRWESCSYYNVDYVGNQVSGAVGWVLTASGGTSSSALAFTGDMDFINCQGIGGDLTYNGAAVKIIDNGNAYSHLSGIRFLQFDFYGGAYQLFMDITGTGSRLEDIWLNPGCQFEGPPNSYATNAIYCSVSGSLRALDLHVQGCYFAGSGFATHVYAASLSGAYLENIWVVDNFLNGCSGISISINGQTTSIDAYNVTIDGNQISNVANSGYPAILLANVKGATVNGNSIMQLNSGTFNSLLELSGGTNYVAGNGNNSNGAISGGSWLNNSASAAQIAFGPTGTGATNM